MQVIAPAGARTVRASRSAAGAWGAGTLGLAAGCWALSLSQLKGMDMGVATSLGSFPRFLGTWVPMMAAMMLPGAVPAVCRRAQGQGGAAAAAPFLASYLTVWAAVGLAAYPLDRPHGTAAAGVLVIAAGVYELTPVKGRLRGRGRDCEWSGWRFGLCCAGSSLGLMVVLLAVSPMSVTWMSLVAVAVLVQKVMPARAAVDVPVALAIAGLGVLALVHPSAVPGLLAPM